MINFLSQLVSRLLALLFGSQLSTSYQKYLNLDTTVLPGDKKRKEKTNCDELEIDWTFRPHAKSFSAIAFVIFFVSLLNVMLY